MLTTGRLALAYATKRGEISYFDRRVWSGCRLEKATEMVQQYSGCPCFLAYHSSVRRRLGSNSKKVCRKYRRNECLSIELETPRHEWLNIGGKSN